MKTFRITTLEGVDEIDAELPDIDIVGNLRFYDKFNFIILCYAAGFWRMFEEKGKE